jgi:hypothetical protein
LRIVVDKQHRLVFQTRQDGAGEQAASFASAVNGDPDPVPYPAPGIEHAAREKAARQDIQNAGNPVNQKWGHRQRQRGWVRDKPD